MVRREHPNDRVGIMTSQQEGGKPDRWRGVPSHGFGENLLFVEFFQLARDRVAKIVVGDDPELLPLRQRLQALDRFLDHALLAVEREQLLCHTLAAKGPKARAAPAGEDYGIEGWFR